MKKTFALILTACLLLAAFAPLASAEEPSPDKPYTVYDLIEDYTFENKTPLKNKDGKTVPRVKSAYSLPETYTGETVTNTVMANGDCVEDHELNLTQALPKTKKGKEFEEKLFALTGSSMKIVRNDEPSANTISEIDDIITAAMEDYPELGILEATYARVSVEFPNDATLAYIDKHLVDGEKVEVFQGKPKDTLNLAEEGYTGRFPWVAKGQDVTIRWDAVPGAQKYEYAVIQVSTGKTVYKSKTTEASFTYPAGNNKTDTSYKVEVYALDKHGLISRGYLTFFHAGDGSKLHAKMLQPMQYYEAQRSMGIHASAENGQTDFFERDTGYAINHKHGLTEKEGYSIIPIYAPAQSFLMNLTGVDGATHYSYRIYNIADGKAIATGKGEFESYSSWIYEMDEREEYAQTTGKAGKFGNEYVDLPAETFTRYGIYQLEATYSDAAGKKLGVHKTLFILDRRNSALPEGDFRLIKEGMNRDKNRSYLFPVSSADFNLGAVQIPVQDTASGAAKKQG